MTRRLALSTSLTVIAALGLTACGTTPASSRADDTTDYSTTATVAPADKTTSSSDQRDLTRMSIDITWDASTPADQRNMCNGIQLFGTDWAADQLREGASDSGVLDWDYAAQLIQGKCGL